MRLKTLHLRQGLRTLTFNPRLLLTGLLLSLRSRQGFYNLLAWLRLLGVLALILRFLVLEQFHGLGALADPFFYAYFIYSLALVLFPRHVARRLDRHRYYVFTIILDTLAIDYFIFLTGYPATEFYLLLLLPLVTAAHFLYRRLAVRVAFIITASYLVALLLMPYRDVLTGILIPWAARTFFLLASTWLYRVQRSLPRANETHIISPAEARNRLEGHLRDLKRSVRYDSVSIQLLYRERLQIVACEGFRNRDEIYQIEFPIDDPRFPNGLVMQTRRAQVVSSEEYPSFRDGHFFAGHIKTWLGIPLISPSTGELFGMMSIDSSEPRAFSAWDVLQATWFARRISSFLIGAALGPAAMTQAASRENLQGLLKFWAGLLPQRTSQWDDDLQAAQELVLVGQKIFRTEDCSIYFLRHKYNDGLREPVLHMVASSAIPSSLFKRRDIKVTGHHGDGLTGLSVHRNRTLNYGAAQIMRSPYHGEFTEHLQYLFSKRSRQVLITPLRDSKGHAIGAIKVENRLGITSEKPFFPVEKHVFEIFAAMVSLILETIRQHNYITRHDEGVHGLRGIIHQAAVRPIDELLGRLDNNLDPDDVEDTIREIRHTLEYVKMSIHGLLSDSDDNLYLETEGLIHALHRYLKSLQDIPSLHATCDCIRIEVQDTRDDELPYRVQEVFFNIAREGILNIVRHSKIDRRPDGFGEICLSHADGIYHLSIRDNGVGFSESDWAAEQKRSFGLNDMKKQIRLLESASRVAALEIDPRPGFGTSIEVLWAPLPVEERE